MKTSSRVISRCYCRKPGRAGRAAAGRGRMPRSPGNEGHGGLGAPGGHRGRAPPPQPQPCTTPSFIFFPKSPPFPSPRLPQESAPAGNPPARGYLGRSKTRLGVHGWGGSGGDSANEASEKRSKGAVLGLPRLFPVVPGSARAASPAPAAFLPGRGGSGRAGAGSGARNGAARPGCGALPAQERGGKGRNTPQNKKL